MRTIGNLIWFVFFGWSFGILGLLVALCFAVSVIGIPLVPATWRMTKRVTWPLRPRL